MIAIGVKASGSRLLTLITSGKVAKASLRAAERKYVAGEGYGFLVGTSGGLFNTTTDMT
jgi:hypothetical protein